MDVVRKHEISKYPEYTDEELADLLDEAYGRFKELQNEIGEDILTHDSLDQFIDGCREIVHEIFGPTYDIFIANKDAPVNGKILDIKIFEPFNIKKFKSSLEKGIIGHGKSRIIDIKRNA